MENLEEKISSLLSYRDALAEDDQLAFDRLMEDAKGRVAACANAAGRLTLLESMLLAMVIAQQKKIESISSNS